MKLVLQHCEHSVADSVNNAQLPFVPRGIFFPYSKSDGTLKPKTSERNIKLTSVLALYCFACQRI
jgi:hypothetical protein